MASRLLTFHALKCLERDLPLPVFGNTNWSQKAWHCVTRAGRVAHNAQPDADLVATRDEFMGDVVHVDSTKLAEVMQFEADRWSVAFSNNVYVHFASHVKKFVRTAFFINKEELKCHAHLLLPALWHMRIQRQVHGQNGFALVPLSRPDTHTRHEGHSTQAHALTVVTHVVHAVAVRAHAMCPRRAPAPAPRLHASAHATRSKRSMASGTNPPRFVK